MQVKFGADFKLYDKYNIRYVFFSNSFNRCKITFYSHDWLAVHDGGDDLAPLIGEKLCGDVLPDPIISSGNELLLIFHSDGTNEEIGFKIGVKAYYQSK